MKGLFFVTGATGFVGRFLCERLMADGYLVRATLLPTENRTALLTGVEPAVVQSLGSDTDWSTALEGVDTVIHLAARVHIMDDHATDPLTAFRKVNVEGTVRLAVEAARCGVKRLLFVSSIKVNGEETEVPYTEESPAQPTEPYGISKWEAEIALRQIEAETDLQVVIVRPTLVYGPGVKANFLNMMKIISRGIPLPLASINNKRSLIYVGNLVDALTICAKHPKAAGQTYLVSDGEDLSTPELIRSVAAAMAVPSRLFPMLVALIQLAGIMTGKKTAVQRLTGSLTVDISKIRQELGWAPPFTMEEGLKETTDWYRSVY